MSEQSVFNTFLELAKDSDDGNMFCFDELANLLKLQFNQQQLKGYISQLEQKKFICKLDGCYFDFEISKR